MHVHFRLAAEMDNNQIVFKIPFIIFLNQILNRLGLPSSNIEVVEINENRFCAFAHISGIAHKERVTYRGRSCEDKTEAEEEAARTAIEQLQMLYNFHIDDFNFQALQRAEGNFQDSQYLYKELLQEYRKLEEQLEIVKGIKEIGSPSKNS